MIGILRGVEIRQVASATGLRRSGELAVHMARRASGGGMLSR